MRTLVVEFLLAITLAGCYQNPRLYAPPQAHAPLFDHGGSADLSLLANFHSYDLRGAYSPVNHLMFCALGSWYANLSDSGEHASHNYREFGAGAYTTFAPGVRGEFLLGYGWGNATGFGRDSRNGPESPAWQVTGAYSRYFGQLTLGFKREMNFAGVPGSPQSLGVILRVADVRFSSINWPQGDSTGTGWFIEPTVVLRIGPRAVQFETQFGLSTREGGKGFDVENPYLSIGAHLTLDEIF